MNPKASPAPWLLDSQICADGTVIVCPDGVAMRMIPFYGRSRTGEHLSEGLTTAQYQANLVCMSASADLLAAAIAFDRAYAACNTILAPMERDALELLRAAIAKAEGK